ncbi:hypothetical protein [Ideonella sp. BN130291]|uniref:hypothetical protein n=1 Tax=Ideonella sp. BN130291 TaxID=3112940 RepID=UPI002E25C26A|nr:hypothetical protein [Ideonella sp. BN130291]
MNDVRHEPAADAPPPDWLRHAVREVLVQAPAYHQLKPEDRRALAQAMVKVSGIAAGLIAEEGEAAQALGQPPAVAPDPPAPPRRPVLARAQEAPGFGASADRIASTTRDVLAAVSFPRFVTDLINGVFKAMLDSSSQQMQMYVQLLNNVSASAEGFEKTQFSLVAIRRWVAEHFPEAIEYDLPEVEPGDDPPEPEDIANIKLRLKPNATMPGAEELRSVLGLGPEESIDASNPEQLVPLARRQIARQRQQMLATMVMMGMQRIVIDSGKINASMRFHIDTRSAASQDRGSQFGMQNRIKASGSFGAGPWGVSAEAENTISYVSTERSQGNEEINTDLDLNSSVEINFRTDYLPLNQMAAQAQADRIRNATLNPAATVDSGDAARQARLVSQQGAERARRTSMDSAIDTASRPLAPATPPARPPATGTGTGSGTTGATSGTGTGTRSGSGAGTATGTGTGTGTATRSGSGTGTTAGTGTGTTTGARTGTTPGTATTTAARPPVHTA